MNFSISSKATMTLLGAAALGLAGYAASAVAELPEIRPFHTLHPHAPEELGRPQFGAVIAVRNDTALVAMPTWGQPMPSPRESVA